MLKIPRCLPRNSPRIPSFFIDFAGSINTETVRSEKSAGSAETVLSLRIPGGHIRLWDVMS